jgi:hypothetical protein
MRENKEIPTELFRLPTYRFPRKIFDYHHKGEERKVNHQGDGNINSPNRKIRTGQKTNGGNSDTLI